MKTKKRIKKAIPTLNVRLLRKVQKHILEEPRRLKMQTWKQDSTEAPCGTIACIAGWTAILGSRGRLKNERAGEGTRIRSKAIKLLGLQRFSGTDNLFCKILWPREFQDRYDISVNSASKIAKITSDRIDYFISAGK